jgi:DNA-binding beta-propeller fold protein YncE
VNHRLFITDSSDSRLDVFNLDSNNDLLDHAADNIINNGSGTAQDTVSGPSGLVYDSANQRLFVSDAGNERIMIFDVSTVSDGMSASNVLGQTDFVNATSATSQSGLSFSASLSETGLAYDSTNQRLFVADYSNNRVLVFDVTAGSVTNGMNAAYVLGQTDFVNATSATSQSGMSGPSGLYYDSANERLFVSDSVNNRVLVFSVSSITNGMNAANVLGQTTFVNATSATSQSGFNTPTGLAYDANNSRLFIFDSGNHRILAFDVPAGSVTNGMNAAAVLGQEDFVSATDYTVGQNTVGSSGASTMNGMFFDATNNRLYASDVNYHRVMIFDFVDFLGSFPQARSGASYSASIVTTSSQGTVTKSLSSGSVPDGLTLDGLTLSGTAGMQGFYTFTLNASDTISGLGYFPGIPRSFTILVLAPLPGQSTSGGGIPADTKYAPPAPTVSGGTGGGWVYTPPAAPAAVAVAPQVQAPPAVQPPLAYIFIRSLRLGIQDPEVRNLQTFLNNNGFTVSASGSGSPGNETSYFGRMTLNAVCRFQVAKGIVPSPKDSSCGIFGPKTRAAVNAK